METTKDAPRLLDVDDWLDWMAESSDGVSELARSVLAVGAMCPSVWEGFTVLEDESNKAAFEMGDDVAQRMIETRWSQAFEIDADVLALGLALLKLGTITSAELIEDLAGLC